MPNTAYGFILFPHATLYLRINRILHISVSIGFCSDKAISPISPVNRLAPT